MTVHRVPADYPTITAAVAVSRAGDTVDVALGEYREKVVITPAHRGIRIIGARNTWDPRPVLDGGNVLDVAFLLSATDVQILGFEMRGFRSAGIVCLLPGGSARL